MRRSYLIASLAVHAGVLLAVFYAGPYSIRAATVERHARKAEHTDLKRRVEELQKIKSLLQRSQKGGTGGSEQRVDGATPQQMLEQARRLADDIAQLERASKARELARLLAIPEAEALRKLPAPAVKAKPAVADSKQALAELKQHQQQARAALLQREQQLERERSGTRLAGASQHGGEGKAGKLAGMGDGGTGKAGKGGAGQAGMPGEDVPNAAMIAITGYINQTGIGLGQAPRGGSWDLSAPGHGVERGYGAFVPTPPVDSGKPRKITAHAIGQGAPFADRIFLNRWHISGPFAGNGRHSIDVVHPPEMSVDLDARYAGARGRTLAWDYLTNPDYPSVPLLRAQDAVYYAYTEVVMAEAGELVLVIGSDDDSKLWLNERLVWVSGEGHKAWYSSPGYVGLPHDIAQWNLSEGKRKLHFKKGRNTLLLKLYNGASLAFFSVVIVGEG